MMGISLYFFKKIQAQARPVNRQDFKGTQSRLETSWNFYSPPPPSSTPTQALIYGPKRISWGGKPCFTLRQFT